MDGAKTARAVKAGRSSCDEGRMVFFFFLGGGGGVCGSYGDRERVLREWN